MSQKALLTNSKDNEIGPTHPRSVADKTDRQALKQAIQLTLHEQTEAVRANTSTFNRNRYKATALIHDYDALKDRARSIKEEAIAHLPKLIDQVTQQITARGGKVYLAKDAQDANAYILSVLKEQRVDTVVKSKSITSEEIHLNAHLQPEGIEVVETDLAEFILQLADEQPSHIVAPAIHYSRERISALFKKHFPDTTEALDSGEALTDFARKKLRSKFLQAQAGISGANLIAADTGSIVLVESEANIRMTTMAPPLHIAVAGIEKLIPRFSDIPVFIELLGASGTGQPLTSYTNIITPPLPIAPLDFNDHGKSERSFHLVLIDNGRMQMREDEHLREALYCIRCSACMNVCANFQTVGGHAFGGESYSGGIGGSWEAGTGTLEKARFSELCTGCSRCVPNCPVRIDIPWLNTMLRHRLNTAEPAAASGIEVLKHVFPSQEKDQKASLSKHFFAHYAFTARWGSLTPRLTNWISTQTPVKRGLQRLFGLDTRRSLPAFSDQPLTRVAKTWLQGHPQPGQSQDKVVIFADSFTNYGHSEHGLALIKILQRLHIEVAVSACVADGRAALSQGLIPTAQEQAMQTYQELESWINRGYTVLVIEPSVYALFESDYRHLLPETDFLHLKEYSMEAVAYLEAYLRRQPEIASRVFDISVHKDTQVFFHGHCQQRSLGFATPTQRLLESLGLKVLTSSVECCGMAGSFGYKEDYYPISERLGKQLVEQINETIGAQAHPMVLASGTSCLEQLQTFGQVKPIHPLIFLESLLAD